MSNSGPQNKEDSIRVLHVDDDASILEISKKILQDIDNSLEIDFAYSVDEAFEKLASVRYDAVVSDYEMPTKNGLDFLKELKEKGNCIPFILFTGKGREEIAIKALNLGADGYYDKQGSIETVYGELVHGIKSNTQRKKAELLLRKSEEQQKAILSNAPIGIATSNSTQKFLSVNPVFCRILGYSEKELHKLTFRDITHPEDIQTSRTFMEKLQSGKIDSFTIEKRYIRKDRRVINGKVTVSAIRDSESKPTLFIAELEDVTERKKAEESILKAKSDWERTFNSVPDCIAILDNKHKIMRINETMAKQLGVTPNQAIGLTCYECIHGTHQPPDFCPFTQTLADGKEHITEVHEPRLGGDFLVSTTPLKDEKGQLIGSVHVARNITELKKTEKELELFSLAVQKSIDGVIVGKPTGVITYVNDAALKMIGANKTEEMVGKHVLEFIAERDRYQVIQKSINCLKTGQAFSGQYTVARKDGSESQIEVTTSPIKDKTGKDIAFVDIIRNVDERQKSENALRESHVQIEAANEKLKVLSGLTRHDVRNKLSGISANTYLISKRYADKPDIVEKMDKIEQYVRESISIFDFAKAYEQLGLERIIDIDVKKAVNEATAMFACLSFKVVNDCDSLTIRADSMFSQLIYNLIDNTRKHGKKTKTARVYYKKTGNSELRLVYEDDGVGVPLENKSKVFTQGFSTGGSTGLGLFLVEKMIEVYGWTITEDGEPGKGARFIITIPIASKI